MAQRLSRQSFVERLRKLLLRRFGEDTRRSVRIEMTGSFESEENHFAPLGVRVR
jgi:hypothetical protein